MKLVSIFIWTENYHFKSFQKINITSYVQPIYTWFSKSRNSSGTCGVSSASDLEDREWTYYDPDPHNEAINKLWNEGSWVNELTMILILVKAIAILRTKKRSKNMLREKKGDQKHRRDLVEYAAKTVVSILKPSTSNVYPQLCQSCALTKMISFR